MTEAMQLRDVVRARQEVESDGYVETVTRKRNVSSDFSDAELWPQFRRYFRTGVRVRVVSLSGYTRTGTVGMTTGQRPAFLLMHRVTDIDSHDVLAESDVIVAEQRGRRYVEVDW